MRKGQKPVSQICKENGIRDIPVPIWDGYISLKSGSTKIPDRVPIENKPALANTRQELGHWQADTAVSRQSKGAIDVLIERQTRLVKRYN